MFYASHDRKCRAFTLIELMIVIAIIGIIAAIAIPQFSYYRKNAFNTEANIDAKNAHTAALAYFNDNPAGSPTEANLLNYGYKKSPHVTLTVTGNHDTIVITARGNANGGTGNITYSVDSAGAITHD